MAHCMRAHLPSCHMLEPASLLPAHQWVTQMPVQGMEAWRDRHTGASQLAARRVGHPETHTLFTFQRVHVHYSNQMPLRDFATVRRCP